MASPMMALATIPGIRFDMREPPPPGFASYQLAAGNIAHQPHRPQPGNPQPDRYHTTNMSNLVAPSTQAGQAFLAPSSATLNIKIVHDTAKFTIVHVFNNRSSDITNGVFQFPLPFEATITEFNYRIGNRATVHGKVKPKDEARREFELAAQQGRAGGLVEQRTPEIFTTTLANLPGNTKMRTQLSFMGFLKHKTVVDHELFTLTVPTFIAPRYGELPAGVRAASQDSYSLSLEVDVLTAEELLNIDSESHSIAYERGAGVQPCQRWEDLLMSADNSTPDPRKATVHLQDDRASLDKDLVITISTTVPGNVELPQACLETHPSYKNHTAVLLTIPSEFMLSTQNSVNDGEIIFVADRSGSMEDKIESLRSAMMFFINGIPENRLFNIWCFGSGYTSMWPRSRIYNETTRQEAMAYVREEFKADMGGTEILSALQGAHASRAPGRSMDVIVLTDGEVWRPSETIGFVKEASLLTEGKTRFFSLGIGGAVSHELVEGIARAGGGYAEVITSASSGGWEDRVVAVLKSAMKGHIGPIHMELEWCNADDSKVVSPPTFKQSPATISTISPFTRGRMFMLFDHETQHSELKAIVLCARKSDGNNVIFRVSPKKLLLPDTTIHKLAARALLGELDRGDSWLHQSTPVDHGIVREEGVRLGCKWSLVSKWTSMFAIDDHVKPDKQGMNIAMEILTGSEASEDTLLLPKRHFQAAPQNSSPSRRRLHSKIRTSTSTAPEECGTANFTKQSRNVFSDNPPISFERVFSQNVWLEEAEIDRIASSNRKSRLLRGLTDSNMWRTAFGVIGRLIGHSRDQNRAHSNPDRVALESELYAAKSVDSLLGSIATDTITQEKVVHGLLMFQKADGKFDFGQDEIIKNTLGPSFLTVVAGLESETAPKETTVTIAVVALLEGQFQGCQSLWVLMVRKAKEFIEALGEVETMHALMEEARNGVKSMRAVVDELRDAETTTGDVVELATAPIS